VDGTDTTRIRLSGACGTVGSALLGPPAPTCRVTDPPAGSYWRRSWSSPSRLSGLQACGCDPRRPGNDVADDAKEREDELCAWLWLIPLELAVSPESMHATLAEPLNSSRSSDGRRALEEREEALHVPVPRLERRPVGEDEDERAEAFFLHVDCERELADGARVRDLADVTGVDVALETERAFDVCILPPSAMLYTRRWIVRRRSSATQMIASLRKQTKNSRTTASCRTCRRSYTCIPRASSSGGYFSR
jgi:hypothetical protein